MALDLLKFIWKTTNSVYDIISLLNTGNNVTIGVGTFLKSNVTVVSTASTFVRIGVGSTSALEIPTGTQVSIGITNPTHWICKRKRGK